MRLNRVASWFWPAVPVVAALLFTAGLLFLFQASPIESFKAM